MSRTGQISVSTNDIFPIIKKWLYSEHDIFLRELVSNACDAIKKRETIARNSNSETPTGKVSVLVDEANKTITINDNGIGMTEEEVEKYIAQLAFSGAEEFANKMKEFNKEEVRDEIIGKFGLGFYSAFMVADKVEINSLSMTEGSKATKWTCEGDTEFTFADSDKNEIGTSITLYINDDSKEFLNGYKTRSVLTRYCGFMPYQIELKDLKSIKETEEANAKAEKPEDKREIKADFINETMPIWKKDPTTLKDEDYKNFYRSQYPMDPEPLFWLHLNVDHPFELQGILYFPKFNKNKPITENSIQLFSKQVFVSDNVKNVIPDFLALLKGCIDSTDIPLNVSRSSLQGDPNIKKISNYIVKKVAESLKKLFKTDRERYETVWEDIQLFVKYGSIGDEKFSELMLPYTLFKNSDAKLVTIEEYQESIPADYKEKMKGKLINFEINKSDFSLRSQLLEEGIHALDTDEYIDPHYMQHIESKHTGENALRWSSVDTAIEEILSTEAATDLDIKIKELFETVLAPKTKENEADPAGLDIEVKNIKNSKSAAYFKVDEQMKRFKQMTQQMGNTQFALPMKKTLVLNPSNDLIKNALKIWDKGEKKDLAEKICFHVQDLAQISSEGLENKEKELFVKRSQELISELSNLAL